jgi:hypothetical protein
MKRRYKHLIFTTNVEKVPMLNRQYGLQYSRINELIIKDKSDIAKENLTKLFKNEYI